MHLAIDHITRYTYSQPAAGIVQLLRLTPQEADCQQVVQWRIDIDADGHMSAFTDVHGNLCHMFYADRPVESITIEVRGTVITGDCAGMVRGTAERLPPLVYRRQTALTTITPAIAGFAEQHRRADRLDTLHTLMLGVRDRMVFKPGVTEAVTDADTAFGLGHGVCQDLAQIFIAAARHLGFPARYVSGHYAVADHPEQEASHAWAEAHIDDLGWIAFDPTHGVCATEGHVRVAIGLDSLEAAPVRGSRRGGGLESLAVGVHGRETARGRKASSQSQSQSQTQAQ